MIRINEIKLSLEEDESLLKDKAAKILKINQKYINTLTIYKKSIDARKKRIFISHTQLILQSDLMKNRLFQNANQIRFSLQNRIFTKSPKTKEVQNTDRLLQASDRRHACRTDFGRSRLKADYS